MKIIVANLSVKYSGRGESFLLPHDRVVMYKEDGAISVHSGKGYKPLNYMMGPTVFEESLSENNNKVWTFLAKDEELVITFHEIFQEIEIPIDLDDPGLQRYGTEHQLQLWLLDNLGFLSSSLEPIEREYQTGDGPVDLLARDMSDNSLVAIEIKRKATINSVGQILRYVESMKEKHPDTKIQGMLAAINFNAKTIELAAKRGIKILNIPNDWEAKNPRKTQEELTQGLFELYD